MFHRNRVTEKEVLQVACKMMLTADYPEDLRLTGELYNNLLFSLHIYNRIYNSLLHDHFVTSSLIGQKPPYTLAIKFI